MRTTALLLASVCALLLATAALGVDYCVSPAGKDTYNGTRKTPFRTLEAARDAIRKQTTHTGATVWVLGGTYTLTKPFQLGPEDSGTPEAPIVYRADKGATVRLVGGTTIPPKAFAPVTDPAVLKRIDPAAREKLLQVDLRALGITDYGAMQPRGVGTPVRPAQMELVYNNNCMQLARWPNDEYAKYGDAISPVRFKYTGDRPARWAGAEDIWVYCCWKWDWADMTLHVTNIDLAEKEITIANPPSFGMDSNRRFYVLNLLEELDTPGEYYIDRKNGILYFWPPTPVAEGQAVVTMLADPMVAMQGVSYTTLRGFTLESTRGMGIYVKGGTHSLIAGCTLRNLGTAAIMIGEGGQGWNIDHIPGTQGTSWNRDGGTHNGVESCDIYNTGAFGIILGGGDRKTLTPCDNFAINNDIHHTNRWYKQNFPPIEVPGGVGFCIANNHIHDCPHSAIMYQGNETLIESNEIDHCVTDSTDAGAIYTGRDPTAMGNTIRGNFIHHIGGLSWGQGTTGVYIDDGSSRQQVVGNIFYKMPSWGAEHINGGQFNVFDNNMVIDCSPSVPNMWDQNLWTTWLQSPQIQSRLKTDTDVTQPPYSVKYPELRKIFETPYSRTSNIDTRSLVTTERDPIFADGAKMDLRVKDWKAVQQRVPGFTPIPFEKIGLYVDEYRRTLPTRK